MRKLLILLFLASIPILAEGKPWKTLNDYQCMVANIYFEARGEGIQGMQAVAKVTMNRVKSKRYPGSVCAVVFQKYQFSWTHQQSWKSILKVANGSTAGFRKTDHQAYVLAQIIARSAVVGRLDIPKLRGSMFYHANYVKPKWASKMKRVAVIGSHVFYRG